MKIFIEPLYEKLRSLELGIKIYLPNDEIKKYYFYLLLGVCDKPARNEITNMKSSNGFYGCLKCLIPGETVKYGNGSHLIYRYDQHINLRNTINYQIDLLNTSHGVLGPCFLNNFKYFQVVESLTIDYMHSICLGVIKNMFYYWFSENNKKYSLKSKLKQLNARFDYFL